jgi:hypothetical protein
MNGTYRLDRFRLLDMYAALKDTQRQVPPLEECRQHHLLPQYIHPETQNGRRTVN